MPRCEAIILLPNCILIVNLLNSFKKKILRFLGGIFIITYLFECFVNTLLNYEFPAVR